MRYCCTHKFLKIIVGCAVVYALSMSVAHAQTLLNNSADLQKLIRQLQDHIKTLQTQIFELNAKMQSQEKELTAVKLELQFTPLENAPRLAAESNDLELAWDSMLRASSLTGFTKTIGRGASGEDVKKLQEFLRTFPDVYPEGAVTGYFGPFTEAAVKKFQEKNGLEPVGVVGPKTRAVLNETALENCRSTTVRPCVDRGAGDTVFILNENSGNNAFSACLNNPSENKTGELFEKTALCDEEKIQFCHEGQSANMIRKFDGSCRVTPVLLPPPPSPKPIVVPPPPPSPTPIPAPSPTSQPSISVLSPNGGEKIPQGSTVTIQWSTVNLVSKSVNIALYKYEGTTWSYAATIATNVAQNADTGIFTYEWKTLHFDIDRNFFIEVSGAGAYPSPTDKSDQPFQFISDYSVRVTVPNGGESWQAGSGQLVRWSATRLQSFPTIINLVKGGAVYRTLSAAALPDYYDGTALVKKLTIPSDVPSGSDYTIEVVVPAIWSTIPEVRDASDKPFSIMSTIISQPPPPPSAPVTTSAVGTPTNTILGWFKGTRLVPTVPVPGSVYNHAFYFKYASAVSSGQSFRVYLKRPGDASYKAVSTFKITTSIPATGCTDIIKYSALSQEQWKIECSTYPYWRVFSPLNSPSFYPIGMYYAYVVAVDDTGVEGPASPVTTNTLLPQSKIISPLGIQATTTPVITWTVPSFIGTNAVYYASVFTANSFVWTGSAMVFPGNNQYSLTYSGSALDPSQTYYTNLWGEMPGYQFSMDEDTMPAFTISAPSASISPPSSSPSPVTVALPIAPTDLKITNGYAPGAEPPQMLVQLSFRYELQSDSKLINVYYRRPTDSQFIKYTHDAGLVASASSERTNRVGDSYMTYVPTIQTWTWLLTSQKSSSDWPVGTYKYYLTSTNASGVESASSPELTFTVISSPTITYPAEGQTVSTPFTIKVTDTALSGQGCANSPHLQMYRANSILSLWEKTFCTSQIYDGPTLTADGNPYRIVFYGSALGGVYSSQIVARYFNVSSGSTATTTSSADGDARLTSVLTSLSSLLNSISRLLR